MRVPSILKITAIWTTDSLGLGFACQINAKGNLWSKNLRTLKWWWWKLFHCDFFYLPMGSQSTNQNHISTNPSFGGSFVSKGFNSSISSISGGVWRFCLKKPGKHGGLTSSLKWCPVHSRFSSYLGLSYNRCKRLEGIGHVLWTGVPRRGQCSKKVAYGKIVEIQWCKNWWKSPKPFRTYLKSFDDPCFGWKSGPCFGGLSIKKRGHWSIGALGKYLEPNWPLFLKVNPPKQCLFQSKRGSFGF